MSSTCLGQSDGLVNAFTHNYMPAFGDNVTACRTSNRPGAASDEKAFTSEGHVFYQSR